MQEVYHCNLCQTRAIERQTNYGGYNGNYRDSRQHYSRYHYRGNLGAYAQRQVISRIERPVAILMGHTKIYSLARSIEFVKGRQPLQEPRYDSLQDDFS